MGVRPSGPALVLLALPLLLLLPGLFGSEALVPVHTDQLQPWRAQVDTARLARMDEAWLPLGSDLTLMFHPQLALTMERLAAGEVPHWNPDNLAGVPLLAQAVHGVFHPPNLLAWVVGLPRAYGWIAWLQTTLAATFTWLLLRRLGVSPWPALMGGFAFALSGFLATRFHWFQITGASIYVPLVLLGVERLMTGGRTGALLVTAVGIGFSLLAGFPQSSLLALYAGALWCAARWCRPGNAGRRAWPPVFRVAAAFVLGLMLGAPQLVPAAALGMHPDSTRTAVAPEVVASLGMRPASLARLALPDLFGHPRDLVRHELPQLRDKGALSRLFQKPNANHVETASTFGVVALVLVLLGLGARRTGRGLAAALLVGGLALALDSPLAALAARLPGLDTADPKRFVLLAGLGGALLGAFGLQRLADGDVPRWFRAAAVILAVAGAAAWLAARALDDDTWTGWIVPRLAATLGVPDAEVAAHADDLLLDLELLRGSLARLALLLALTAMGVVLGVRHRAAGVALLIVVSLADLGGQVRAHVAFLPADGYFAEPPALAALQGDGTGRLIRYHPGDIQAVGYPLPPNTGLPFGIPDQSGYITLGPRRLETLHRMLPGGKTFGVGTAALDDPAALDSPLLDLMAVDRVLSSVELDRPGLTRLERVGDLWLYRRDRALPRAWAVPRPQAVEIAPGAEGAAAWLAQNGGRTSQPLVEVPGAPAAPPPPAPVGAGTRYPVRLLTDEPEHVSLELDARAPAWLFLSDSFLPGWEARVDGEPAEIHAAHLAFRAVAVPAGTHRVAFRYETPGWALGRNLGLVAVAACLLLLVLSLRGRRRAPAGDPADRPTGTG